METNIQDAMTRDRDDLFERLEEMFEELEERMDELSEESGSDSPFDGPFGGPFGGGPFGDGGPFGEDGPFGDGGPFGSRQETATEEESPSVGLFEVYDETDEVVVVADLPGFAEEDISLTADAERVRIQAVATDEMRRESVSHVYNLPAEVHADQADATLENGVLTVQLPKVDPDDDDDDQTSITIE